jgi:hypothetical protein
LSEADLLARVRARQSSPTPGRRPPSARAQVHALSEG